MTTSPTRSLATLAAAAALAIGLATSPARAEDPARLLTIVATPEPQTQLMAMILTMQAVQQGAEARVLLCGPGGDIALADAPESATAPQAPRDLSPQGMMRALMGEGVTVEVCAIYLPNAGIGQDALVEGVTVAAPPEVAGYMIGGTTRLLTF